METHKQQKACMEAEKAEQKRKVRHAILQFSKITSYCIEGFGYATEISTVG